jgi:uncharacterized protein (DUF983 family)
MAPTTWRCPSCGGAIARWALQPAFSCHHCGQTLAANLSRSLRVAWACAVVAEVLLLAALWLTTGSADRAFGVYLLMSCVLGVVAWHLGFRAALKLRPLAGAARA